MAQVHHEQDSKTNTVDTTEDAVMIIYSRSTSKKKAKTECEEDIPDSIKDQDSLQEEEEEENSPNNLTTAKSTTNILFLKTATTPNIVTTSKKKAEEEEEKEWIEFTRRSTREADATIKKTISKVGATPSEDYNDDEQRQLPMQHTTRLTKKAIRWEPSMTSHNQRYLATRH